MLVEGGARIAAALLAGDLVDRVYLFNGGLVLGADAHPAIGDLGIGALALAPRFRHISELGVGADRLQLWAR